MNLKNILTLKNLERAFQKVADNRGSSGIDGISAQRFATGLSSKLRKLILEIMTHKYKAQPCKVVYIPKSNGKLRQLAIPTIRDRTVHTAISQAFVPFFERHFERCSYGYRPKRNYLQAVKQIEYYRDKGFDFVLDADISNYFNNISHNLLEIELLRYVNCKKLIKLIFSSFRQMQYDGKKRVFGEDDGLGLPQGSPLSPVLANMYLDPLDEALMSKSFKIIRYADDFVVLCKSMDAAGEALNITKDIFDKYQLTLNTDKTRVTDFESGFVFLGHFFIGNLVQKLASSNQKMHEVSWQWDALSFDSEKYKHAFSGKPLNPDDEGLIDENYAELQHEILGCEELKQNNKKPNSNLNLSSKLRTLYLFKQGSVIHKIAGKIEVRHSGDTIQQIPITQIDSIMCFGSIHLTRAVMLECFQNALPIIFMTRSGHWQGIIKPYVSIDKTLMVKQLESHNQPLPIAMQIVTAKLQNCTTTIRRYLRYHNDTNTMLEQNLNILSKLKKRINHCKTLQSLRGIEGNAAKIYFGILQAIIPKKWGFNNRNRRPPKDPVNALLSLGYTVLFNNVYAFVMLRELVMEYGYLHAHYHKQPALALDMMEPFRTVIVDAVVLKLIKNNVLNINDFSIDKNKCLLSTKAKKVFITALEQQMSKELSYPALNIKTDYRRIMDLQILLLKQSLLNKQIDFSPFTIK